ncbi:MAG: trypsin-like peptidase domain-containing protein, partial [Planctomycetaceae bacterium]
LPPRPRETEPAMLKRPPLALSGLCAVVLVSLGALAAEADGPRETPLVQAIRRARDSVVNIHSEKTSRAGEDLFASSSKPRKINGMGTGIIIDERGYIVTNHHVVNGVDTLRVTLDDGGTFNGRIVSYDRVEDLAIIKIDASTPLDVMPLGTSSDLMLGETVIAVGNAFGYEHTVTAGIISALSRDVEVNESQSYQNLIQTDASINPGNSGGPLLNMEGEVIGINVAIRAGAQRIGFAIPIDDARVVIARLLSVEKLGQAQHGLLAADHKQGDQRELVVESARLNSPAAAAGFESGDVVLKVNGKSVIDGADFERALVGEDPGTTVSVVVRRDDQTETLSLTLAPYRGTPVPTVAPQSVAERPGADSFNEKAWQSLGMKLAPVAAGEPRIARSRYRGGMRVLDVRTGGPAQRHGIRAGDILVGLHKWETVNEDNVAYVLDHPQFGSFNPLTFYILRDQETLYGHMQLVSGQ